MKNPLVSLIRRYALRQHRSAVPTSLLPLCQVKSVTVFVDAVAMGEDPAPVCRAVQHYFESISIPVIILCPEKTDVNWWGYLKPKARGGRRDERKEDLFISLASQPGHFASEYEARCSTARFKVGCCALPDGVFDLVVTPPEGAGASQTAAFAAVKDYLNKIR